MRQQPRTTGLPAFAARLHARTAIPPAFHPHNRSSSRSHQAATHDTGTQAPPAPSTDTLHDLRPRNVDTTILRGRPAHHRCLHHIGSPFFHELFSLVLFPSSTLYRRFRWALAGVYSSAAVLLRESLTGVIVIVGVECAGNLKKDAVHIPRGSFGYYKDCSSHSGGFDVFSPASCSPFFTAVLWEWRYMAMVCKRWNFPLLMLLRARQAYSAWILKGARAWKTDLRAALSPHIFFCACRVGA